MRLNVPVETTNLTILNGPGATKMLDTSIARRKTNDHHAPGPRLTFTVANPGDGTPLEQVVEMISNWDQIGGHYELEGFLVEGGYFVHIKYWLSVKGGDRGTIYETNTNTRSRSGE